MPSVKLYNNKAAVIGDVELSEAIFAVEYNEPLIHQAVVTYLANQRQGTKSALTRTEVRGGGCKPWRQKGTGRARQGSIRAPQWIKGGVVFAPKPRDFSKKLNVKARRAAIRSALSQRVVDGGFTVLNEYGVSSEAKTKEIAAMLKAFSADKRTLILTSDENVLRAARNIENVTVTRPELVNVYDVVVNTKVFASQAALQVIEEVYA